MPVVFIIIMILNKQQKHKLRLPDVLRCSVGLIGIVVAPVALLLFDVDDDDVAIGSSVFGIMLIAIDRSRRFDG